MKKSKYGNIYRVVEFMAHLIPKRKSMTKEDVGYVHDVIDFLMKLDNIQQRNWAITVVIHARDGIWLYYHGVPQFLLKPTHRYLLFHIFQPNELSQAIENVTTIFHDRSPVSYAHGVWHIACQELVWLLDYIEANMLPPKEPPITASERLHPRNIPGDIRQLVLAQFIDNGRMCHGVYGKTKPHKLTPTSPIEFDHILPYSQGGASTYDNVQVLCMECNRIKQATAL